MIDSRPSQDHTIKSFILTSESSALVLFPTKSHLFFHNCVSKKHCAYWVLEINVKGMEGLLTQTAAKSLSYKCNDSYDNTICRWQLLSMTLTNNGGLQIFLRKILLSENPSQILSHPANPCLSVRKWTQSSRTLNKSLKRKALQLILK